MPPAMITRSAAKYPASDRPARQVYSQARDPRTRLALPNVPMLIHELSPNECAEVLGRIDLGRLGCARFDQPYIVPIHFSFDAERNCVYAFSTIGQKIEWMRENPKVCLEVDEIDDKNHWTTVLVTGRYEEIHQAIPTRARRASVRSSSSRSGVSGGFPRPRKWNHASITRRSCIASRLTALTGRRAARDRTDPAARCRCGIIPHHCEKFPTAHLNSARIRPTTTTLSYRHRECTAPNT